MRHLVILISTGAYTGFFPVAPGTVATLVAALIFFAAFPDSIAYRILITSIFIIASIFASSAAEIIFSKKDDQRIVIDEFAGYFLSVLLIPKSVLFAVLSVVLFRFFDIIKPLGIKRLQKINGGLGIVIDDLAAGLASLVIMKAIEILI